MNCELSGKRVLLTGGRGFLGQVLCEKLLQHGVELHSIVRRVSNTESFGKNPLRFFEHLADLTNGELISNLVREIKPDIIFHIAASGGASGLRDRHSIFLNNVYATHNLLLACESLECKIVYTGGSTEYGHKTKPLIENELLEPISSYAAAKAAATLLVQQFAKTESADVILLRPFSIYGIHEPAQRLIPTAIRAGLKGATLKLTGPGFVRDYVYVEDVADACIRAASVSGISGEIINIASGIQTSNEQVVKLISQILGKSIDIEVGAYQAHATDTKHWRADISKAKALLNWSPRVELQQGLEKTITWRLQNG